MITSDSDEVVLDLQYFSVFSMPLRSTGASERHWTSRGRATEPRLPNTAAVGVGGETTGVTAKVGERGAPKGALPATSCLIPVMAMGHKT